MANIVITTTTTAIHVAFNDLASTIGIDSGVWSKSSIISIELHNGSSYVYIDITRAADWHISYDGVNGLQVDSIDGVTPLSNQDIYDALKVLM